MAVAGVVAIAVCGVPQCFSHIVSGIMVSCCSLAHGVASAEIVAWYTFCVVNRCLVFCLAGSCQCCCGCGSAC